MEESQQLCVYSVTVEANIIHATSTIKFPCYLCITWKTNDMKSNIESGRFPTVQGKSQFGQSLTLTTQIAYNKSTNFFLKKQTQLQLNLISKSHLDQLKLVGRTTINIADILNDNRYSIPTDLSLQFCSVNASVLASFKIVNKLLSDIQITDLQNVASSKSISQKHSDINSSSLKQSNNQFLQSSAQKNYFMKKSLTQSVKMEKMDQNCISKESPIKMKETIRIQIKKESKVMTPLQNVKHFTPQKQSVFAKKSNETMSSTKIISSSINNNFNHSNSLKPVEYNTSSQSREVQQKLMEQLNKIRGQYEQLKKQNDKNRQQYQKSRQQADILKLQLKQKQGLVDQISLDLTQIKKQSTILRHQLTGKIKETVELTLTVGQLKDSNNKLNQQMISYQRQIHKLQQIKGQFQRTESTQKQLTLKLSEYQKTIVQLNQKLKNYQKEKNNLSINLQTLNDQLMKTSTKLTQKQLQSSSNKQSFSSDLEEFKKKLYQQNKAKSLLEQQIVGLNKQRQMLSKRIKEFSLLQESWSSDFQSLSRDIEIKQKRIGELEQCIISLGDKAKDLQNQNKQLRSQVDEHKSQLFNLSQQSQKEIHKLQDDLLRASQQLQELKLTQSQLIQTRDENVSKLIMFEQANVQLTQQNSAIKQTLNNLINSCEQLKLKRHQLEELLITTSQHQNNQISTAQQQMSQFKLKGLEFEGQIRRLANLLQGNQQKLARTQQELTNRQNLIVRLQQGLKKQIQHSQQLNRRLMSYILREDRVKDVISQMQSEYNRVTELLVEQQIREKLNAQLTRDKNAQIKQIVSEFQKKIQQCNSQHESMLDKERSFQQQIQHLMRKIVQRQSEIKELKTIMNNNNSIITKLRQNIQEVTKRLEEEQIHYQNIVKIANNKINELEQDGVELKKRIQGRQLQLEDLSNKLSAKQSELLLVSMKFQSQCVEMRDIQQSNVINEQNYQIFKLQLEEQCNKLNQKNSQLNNQLSQAQATSQEEIWRLKAQIQELKDKLQTLIKEQQSFDINRHKFDIQEKDKIIGQFEEEVKRLEQEASKIHNLQRTIKLQTIELNSFKFKGKIQEVQENNNNELLKLKDQQIALLTRQKNRLEESQQQMIHFKQKVEALQTQLALLEEEKFNIQQMVNQKNLALEQFRQENKNLTEEIQIIGERNGQLQRTIYEMVNKQVENGDLKGQATLKAENMLLKNQLREIQNLKKKIADVEEDRQKIEQKLQESEEKHMLDLIDQQIKLTQVQSNPSLAEISIKRSQKILNQSSLNLPNMSYTYKILKELLDNRQKSRLDQKLKKYLEILIAKQPQFNQFGAQFQQRARCLQKQLKKIKFNQLKSVADMQEKAKLITLFKNCEDMLAEIINLTQEASN